MTLQEEIKEWYDKYMLNKHIDLPKLVCFECNTKYETTYVDQYLVNKKGILPICPQCRQEYYDEHYS